MQTIAARACAFLALVVAIVAGSSSHAAASPATPSVPPATATSGATASASTAVTTAPSAPPATAVVAPSAPRVTASQASSGVASTTQRVTAAATAATSSSTPTSTPSSAASFSITADKTTADVQSVITYTITISNRADAPIRVTPAVLPPESVLFGESDYPVSSAASMDHRPPAGYQPLFYLGAGEGIAIPANSVVKVLFTVKVLDSAAGNDMVMYAQVADGDTFLPPSSPCPAGFAGDLPAGSCTTTTISTSALSLTKQVCAAASCTATSSTGWAAAATKPAHSAATWRLTVANTGSTPLKNVTVSDADLGSSLSVTLYGGDVSGALWRVGDLASGQSVVLLFQTVTPENGVTAGASSIVSANGVTLTGRAVRATLTGTLPLAVPTLADTGAPQRSIVLLATFSIVIGSAMLVAARSRRRARVVAR